MSRPTLQHLQVADLVAQAGGDPWAVDDSLQAGSPTQINFLAQAFHQAAGSANAAEETFRTAEQHFQQYHRENGEQPINNGAEVTRVKDGLHATNQQLGQIAADLETIAGNLAEARQTSQEDIEALNGNLEGLDALVDYYITLEDEGYDYVSEITQCCQQAKDDTATTLGNVSLNRSTYSKTLQQALTNLRVKDGYDPDVEVRKVDAEDGPTGADGGMGSAGGTNGTPSRADSGDGGAAGFGASGANNGVPSSIDGAAGGLGATGGDNATPPGADGAAGGLGNTPGAPADGIGGDGGGAALPPWLAAAAVPGISQPGAPNTPAARTQPTQIGGNWGNVGDAIAATSSKANEPWIREGLPGFVPGGSPGAVPGGIPMSQGLESVERFGKGLGYAGAGVSMANGVFEFNSDLDNGVSWSTAAVDVVPKTVGDVAGAWVGASMGAETGGEVGAVIGTFFGPGPGTAVGAVVGAGAGAAIGGLAGSKFGSALGEGISDASHSIWHGLFG